MSLNVDSAKAGRHGYDFCCLPTCSEDVGAPDKSILPIYPSQKGLQPSITQGNVVSLAKLGVPYSTIQLMQSFHQDMQATI